MLLIPVDGGGCVVMGSEPWAAWSLVCSGCLSTSAVGALIGALIGAIVGGLIGGLLRGALSWGMAGRSTGIG